jgi:prophage regulatory protein
LILVGIPTIMSETKSTVTVKAEADLGPTNHSKFPRFSSDIRRVVRRPELRQIVPLADTTIYVMEQRGEFPRRFYLTPRCVVWDLAEVEAWLDERRRASNAELINRAPAPDVRRRKSRPVRQ